MVEKKEDPHRTETPVTQDVMAGSGLPSALFDLLVQVRKGLKTSPTATVKLGMREVNAIYYMHTELQQAREMRDNLRAQLRALKKNVAEYERTHKALNSREFLNVLRTAEAVLSGESDSAQAVHDALQGIQKMLKGR